MGAVATTAEYDSMWGREGNLEVDAGRPAIKVFKTHRPQRVTAVTKGIGSQKGVTCLVARKPGNQLECKGLFDFDCASQTFCPVP